MSHEPDPDKFRAGDPVRVKNIPGPRMIVTGFAEDRKAAANIHCKWFDKRGELQGQWFPAKLIYRISPWVERPGYRVALEKIRAIFGEDQTLWVDNNTTLGMYITDILAHTHPSTRGAAAEEVTEEHADAAD